MPAMSRAQQGLADVGARNQAAGCQLALVPPVEHAADALVGAACSKSSFTEVAPTTHVPCAPTLVVHPSKFDETGPATTAGAETAMAFAFFVLVSVIALALWSMKFHCETSTVSAVAPLLPRQGLAVGSLRAAVLLACLPVVLASPNVRAAAARRACLRQRSCSQRPAPNDPLKAAPPARADIDDDGR